MSSMGIGNKPCLDIRPSADQISDRSISVAQLSKSKYIIRIISWTFLETVLCCWPRWLIWNCNIIILAPRFRNSIAVSVSEDSGRCSRRPHSVISVSSSSSSGGSSGPPTTLNLGLDTSPRPHHRSTTLNSQCSVGESRILFNYTLPQSPFPRCRTTYCSYHCLDLCQLLKFHEINETFQPVIATSITLLIKLVGWKIKLQIWISFKCNYYWFVFTCNDYLNVTLIIDWWFVFYRERYNSRYINHIGWRRRQFRQKSMEFNARKSNFSVTIGIDASTVADELDGHFHHVSVVLGS